MKIRLLNILILFSAINLIFISSCEKVQTEIPAYLKVNTAGVNDSSYGINTSNIYGLNFQVGNDNRGRWQMPFSAPVLKFGTNQTYIEPMVKYNNHSTAFYVYPLYDPLIIPMNFESGKVIDTTFYFKYNSLVNLVFYEDNEFSNNFSNSVINTAQAKYGKKCILMDATLNTNDSNSVSVYFKQLPLSSSKETYLELDYYMPNGVLAPTLLYQDSTGTRVLYSGDYLVSNQGWTHVYWNLTPSIRKYPQAQYSLAFELTPKRGDQTATAYLDNIKILEK